MNNDEMSTTPTIETLLGRLNEWGERFTNELKDLKAGQQELGNGLGEVRTGLGEVRAGLSDLRNGQEELRKGQEEFRNELNAGLRRVERKIEILNDNIYLR